MTVVFHIGRILLVLVFVWAGFGKLLDIAGAAEGIAAQVRLPALVADLAPRLESALGLPWPRQVAIVAGLVQVTAALLIVFNIGTRWAALVLLLYTAGSIVIFHAFWTADGAARTAALLESLQRLALAGGLMMLFVLGSWRPPGLLRAD
jgi:putative oxidoreductase